MSEPKLLTEEQISCRKNSAIWLLGIGLILSAISPILFEFIRISISRSGDMTRIVLYESFQLGFNLIVNLLIIIGLILIKRFENRSISRWVKHWIFAYLLLLIGDCLFGPLQSLIFRLMVNPPDYTMADHAILTTRIIMALLFFILPFVYMFWSIDSVRRNSSDSTTLHGVRIVQSALALILFMGLIVRFSSGIYYYNQLSESSICEGGGFLAFYILVIPIFVLFSGLKQLIRSPLFASTSEDLAAFREEPLRKGVAFPRSVCGLVLALMVCLGLTLLLTVYWNELYYEIF